MDIIWFGGYDMNQGRTEQHRMIFSHVSVFLSTSPSWFRSRCNFYYRNDVGKVFQYCSVHEWFHTLCCAPLIWMFPHLSINVSTSCGGRFIAPGMEQFTWQSFLWVCRTTTIWPLAQIVHQHENRICHFLHKLNVRWNNMFCIGAWATRTS